MIEWWQRYFDKDIAETLFTKERMEQAKRECDGIEALLKIPKGAKILDLACGVGRHTIELAKRGYEMVGLDYTKEYIKIAQKRAKRAGLGIKFICEDMREISFDNEFDAALNLFTSFGYFEDEKDHLRVLKGVVKSLKPKGKFLLDIVNRDWIIRHFQVRSWSEGEGYYFLEDRRLDLERSRNLARVILIKGRQKKEYTISLRLFSLSELFSLFQQARLKVIGYYGGFEKEPWSFDNFHSIILGEKTSL